MSVIHDTDPPQPGDGARIRRMDAEPYLTIYDMALERGYVTSFQVADMFGFSVVSAKNLIYRMVFTGALIPGVRTGHGIRYLPGQAAGCRKVIDLARKHSMTWVSYAAMQNPPGAGARL